jgi:hypothetical protein
MEPILHGTHQMSTFFLALWFLAMTATIQSRFLCCNSRWEHHLRSPSSDILQVFTRSGFLCGFHLPETYFHNLRFQNLVSPIGFPQLDAYSCNLCHLLDPVSSISFPQPDTYFRGLHYLAPVSPLASPARCVLLLSLVTGNLCIISLCDSLWVQG